MIGLDTNIVPELLRPSPEPRVEAWLAACDSRAVCLTTVSEAELHYGVAILPAGQRRDTCLKLLTGCSARISVRVSWLSTVRLSRPMP